jgi:transcriptional regulator with XRE-family HTH domain
MNHKGVRPVGWDNYPGITITPMVRPMLTPAERERGARLGALLRQARGDRLATEIAARSGVPVETLRKIESGRIPTPAFFTIVALADALGVPLDRLVAAGEQAAERVQTA